MGDICVQHPPHIRQTTARRQWHQGTHNVSMEVVKALSAPHTWPRGPAAQKDTFPSKPSPQQSIKQLDRPQKPSEMPSTPQHQIQPQDAPGQIRSPSSVSNRIKNLEYGVERLKHLDELAETPSSQRMEVDTPSPLDLGARMPVSGDSSDRFWMGPRVRPLNTDEPATSSPLSRRQIILPNKYSSHMRNDDMEMKTTTATTAANDDDADSASTCSFSVLSDDIIASPPQPRLIRFTKNEESDFFNHIYNILDASLSEWEERVNYQSGQPLSLENIEDAIVDLPSIRESSVIFGRRPNRQGFWKGRLELTGKYTEIKKLRSPSFENGIDFGVEIGSIEDFESMGGAILFMGIDRRMYYTDYEGWFDLDEFGRYCYEVIGPYDFRSLSKNNVLDPLPKGPAIVWGNEMGYDEKSI